MSDNVKLRIDNISLSFGGVEALVNISIPTEPARPACQTALMDFIILRRGISILMHRI